LFKKVFLFSGGFMEALKKKILEEGRVFPGEILKVDSFINHQIDVDLLDKIGKHIASKFPDVTKIVTIETSGIAFAVGVSYHLGKVPVVFAKKEESAITKDDNYYAPLYSYTKKKEYQAFISKKYLSENDRVLIVDDFLAKGNAVIALMEIIKQSNAEIVGVGIVIEKAFQSGRERILSQGLKLESCVKIASLSDGIKFLSK
jgi:xanthine phosphoribosyltransferase